MPLGELLSAIEILRERIANHQEHLQTNSARTRLPLEEPILRALDWDTGDPDQVIPE